MQSRYTNENADRMENKKNIPKCYLKIIFYTFNDKNARGGKNSEKQ